MEISLIFCSNTVHAHDDNVTVGTILFKLEGIVFYFTLKWLNNLPPKCLGLGYCCIFKKKFGALCPHQQEGNHFYNEFD